MSCRLRLLCPVLLVLGCSLDQDRGGSSDGDTPEPSLTGSITLRNEAFKAQEGLRAFALTSDGRVRAAFDAEGVAKLVDPTLVGAQDITVAWWQTGATATDWIGIATLLGVNVAEVDVGAVISGGRRRPEPRNSRMLQGRVTGGAADKRSVVVAQAGDVVGQSQVAVDGTFTVQVFGDLASPVDVVGLEHTESGGYGNVVAFGLVRGVMVSETPTDVTIPLSIAFDTTVAVGVTQGCASEYWTAGIAVTLDGAEVATSELTGEPGREASVKSPAASALGPFSRKAVARCGSDGDPTGRAIAMASIPSGASRVDVRMAPSPAMVAPTMINSGAATSQAALPRTSLANLRFEWTTDPETDLAVMDWRLGPRVRGLVFAPPGSRRYEPRDLPSDLGAPPILRADILAVELSASDLPGFSYARMLGGDMSLTRADRDGFRMSEIEVVASIE